MLVTGCKAVVAPSLFFRNRQIRLVDSPRHVHTYQVHSVTDKLLIHYLEMPDLTQIDPLQKRRPKLNLTI